MDYSFLFLSLALLHLLRALHQDRIVLNTGLEAILALNTAAVANLSRATRFISILKNMGCSFDSTILVQASARSVI